MSVRNRQIVRQWQLLRLLSESAQTVLELAGALRVTKRTVYRDLDALAEAGFGPARVQDGFPPVRYRCPGLYLRGGILIPRKIADETGRED